MRLQDIPVLSPFPFEECGEGLFFQLKCTDSFKALMHTYHWK